MNVKGICSYKIVKMMMCTHTNTKSDSHNTICIDCGIVLDINIMTAALDDAIDAISRKIANETLDSGRAYTVCYHTSKDTDDSGIPLCTECGLTFEDEIVYANEVYSNEVYNGVYDMDQHHHPRTSAETEDKAEKADKVEKADHKHEIIPRNVKDLITIAKGRGIKGSTSMSKKKLCEILGLEIVKPDKLAFRNKDTGEERRFKSIYQASKEMGVNPGLIQHYIVSGKAITVGGVEYNIYETQTSTR